MKKNKFVLKFIQMSFEEKKSEIMRLLKDLLEYSVRARNLWKIIPNMEDIPENNEILIQNYSDLIEAIDTVKEEQEEEKRKQIEEKVKKLEENRKIISKNMKKEIEENDNDLDSLLEEI